MKQAVLGLFITLLSVSFNANASIMAKTTIPAGLSITEGFVQLFSTEATRPDSKLNSYLKKLKANPDYEDYEIDNFITTDDIVRLDSGASAGSFGIDYLILIRGGYKSSTTTLAYLKATAYGKIDIDDTTMIEITEPAKVSIE